MAQRTTDRLGKWESIEEKLPSVGFYLFMRFVQNNKNTEIQELTVIPFKAQTYSICPKIFPSTKGFIRYLYMIISFYVGHNLLLLFCSISIEGLIFKLGVVTSEQIKQQLCIHTCGLCYWLL